MSLRMNRYAKWPKANFWRRHIVAHWRNVPRVLQVREFFSNSRKSMHGWIQRGYEPGPSAREVFRPRKFVIDKVAFWLVMGILYLVIINISMYVNGK